MQEAHFIIITGTNGVGKSTFGENLEKQSNIPFINIDIFYKEKFGEYREYSKEEMLEATQELNAIRKQYFISKQSFMQEMIINNITKVEHLLDMAKNSDFKTSLFYIGTNESLNTSYRRVKDRFEKGLHFVESKTIENNLANVVKNFKILTPKFDNVVIYDNSKYYSNAKRILDIRNGKIHLKRDLPLFVKELVKDTFIEEQLKTQTIKLQQSKQKNKSKNYDFER